VENCAKVTDCKEILSEIAIVRQELPADHQNKAGFLKNSALLSDLQPNLANSSCQ
jgi:hypothetical protein